MAIRLRPEGEGGGYPLLLVLLLGMFAVQPLAARSAAGEALIPLVYAALLLSALRSITRYRYLAVIALLLVLPALVFQNAPGLEGSPWTIVGDMLSAVFLLVVVAAVLKDVLTHRLITLRTVYGAVCVFLLMGLIWSVGYHMVDALLPGSFDGLDPRESSTREAQLFYFSFVTLTTLGYGDVAPRGPEAMTLATLEAVVGQLYLVVLVAYFVGRRVSRGSPEPSQSTVSG